MIKLDDNFKYLLDDAYYLIKPRCSETEYVSFYKDGKTVYLHRMVMERSLGRKLCKSETVDHINKNGLDNRVSNLRIASMSMNCGNRNKPRIKQSSSKYKGVSLEKSTGKWIVRIMKDYKIVYRGRFNNEEEAGLEYNNQAIKFFGEYSQLNTIKGELNV